MAEYIAWDYSRPGISFRIKPGRIGIFKKTLEVMGYPEYFRFLFSPEDMIFGIEPCGIDDKGAKRMPEVAPSECIDVSSLNLVRFVYRTCGWDQKVSYRIAGEVHGRMVYFDLDKAYEIHEGRVLEVSDEKKHQKTIISTRPSVTPS